MARAEFDKDVGCGIAIFDVGLHDKMVAVHGEGIKMGLFHCFKKFVPVVVEFCEGTFFCLGQVFEGLLLFVITQVRAFDQVSPDVVGDEKLLDSGLVLFDDGFGGLVGEVSDCGNSAAAAGLEEQKANEGEKEERVFHVEGCFTW